jgi:hypothetical protein
MGNSSTASHKQSSFSSDLAKLMKFQKSDTNHK